MSLGDAAAALPWPVFPCGDNKAPIVETGFKAATHDHAKVIAQFDRPGAVMIGVPMGAASGLVAIDVDVKNGARGREWLDENSEALPPTRTHKTRSGGLHLIFLAPAGVIIRNSASKLGPGVDVRGEGGYIIAPPSPGYVVADSTEPADMPTWLVRACLREEAKTAPPPRSHVPHERYVQRALDEEVLAVMRAAEGTRNARLNEAAFKLGTLIGAGQIARSTAEAELQHAGQTIGLTAREIAATIKSGLDAGAAHPREMPAQRLNGYVSTTAHWSEPPPEIDDPGYWQSVDADARDATEPPDIREERPQEPFPATALQASDLESIPPRELVYGHFLFKKFISALGAPGGAGKTAYAFVVALAIATGKDLLGEGVHEVGPVWIYNLEDPRVELLRRVKAAMIGHDLQWRDLNGRLFLDSGRDRSLIIAHATRDGGLIAWPQVPSLIAEIKARGIKLLVIDPFVRSHRVEENYNDQIDFVAALWASIADAADCAILLVHHFNKRGVSGDASAFRGATALIDATRSAVTIATMSADEAKEMSVIEKDRWQYVRTDNAKLNLAPPPDAAVWLRLWGVDLDNAANGRKSDSVQTVKRWQVKKVSAFQKLQPHQCNEALDAIETGCEPGVLFTSTRRGGSGRWAGNILMQRFDLNDKQATEVITAWLKTGLLIEANYMHPQWRRLVPGVQVDNTKRPT